MAGIKFLNNLKLFSENLFDEVVLIVDCISHQYANNFLELYKSMNFPLKSIVVEMTEPYQDSLSENNLKLEYTDMLAYVSDPTAVWKYSNK